MKHYLFILSRNSSESGDLPGIAGLAAELAHAGHRVTGFLVQNAVLSARTAAGCSAIKKLIDAGIEVLADSYSLVERGIDAAGLKAGVRPAALDLIIDHLADGAQVLWY